MFDKALSFIVDIQGHFTAASSERGAGLIEYALLVGLIAIVCVASVGVFGGNISDNFGPASDGLTTSTT